jgi:hypothetical protein
VREAIERGLAAFGYYLDESDPGFIVVCRQNGSFVAALSAILASVHLPKPRSEQCSYPFTDRFSRHLEAVSKPLQCYACRHGSRTGEREALGDHRAIVATRTLEG